MSNTDFASSRKIHSAAIFLDSNVLNNSVITLSCDRSVPSSKASSPHSATWCPLFGFPGYSEPLIFISRCSRLLPYLLFPSIFPSISFFFLQGSLCARWDKPSYPPLLLYVEFFFSLALYNISSFYSDILHPSPAPHFITFMVLLIYFPNCPSFGTAQSYAPK